ncbi:MAG TPA: alpha/beta family hydrolase [Candidatus Acidoferrales bacterium]|nr:alpha/beta family hydrolase [Candidatus Acidoferrales bacterium]
MDAANKIFHRSLFLNGPAGRLEALLWTSGAAAPAMAGLVCHPHPLFRGTMHNKVVFRGAKSLHRAGLPVLRFNFRGVGLSEGQHDCGRGERDDVRSALDFLSAEFPGLPVVLAGFSFGAWVGLRVGAEDARVAQLAGLGIPVNDSDFSYLSECAKPKLFVVGSEDQFAARERVESLVASLPEPKRLVFVEGADHFFTGKLDQVDRAIREWLASPSPER